jgi:hypothetical protein
MRAITGVSKRKRKIKGMEHVFKREEEERDGEENVQLCR